MTERLKQIKEQAIDLGIPIIKDDALKLLTDILYRLCPQKILEIGTATGYSAASMLLSLQGQNTELYTVEIDEARADLARLNFKYMGYSQRVRMFVGDAADIIPLMTGKYGFIFLDGPKGQYKNMLPYLIELLPVGGCLFCDNVLYRGLVDGSTKLRRKKLTIVSNLRQFIDDAFDDARLRSFLSYKGDGALICIREH